MVGLRRRAAEGEPRDFLRAYLAHAPAALALLRAAECRELAEVTWQRPLLDLGCGDGLMAQVLESRPDMGLDRSPRELRTAVWRDSYRAVLCSDIASLPFAERSFATVFSNGVLEHVHDLRAGLTEVARVLRPGGRLILTVPTPAVEHAFTGTMILRGLGWGGGERRYRELYNRVFGQINLYGLDEWRALLARCGLVVREHRHYASPALLRWHDLLLWASVPGYVCKRLMGRWTLLPGLRRALTAPAWAALLRRAYQDAAPGCMLMIVAEVQGKEDR